MIIEVKRFRRMDDSGKLKGYADVNQTDVAFGDALFIIHHIKWNYLDIPDRMRTLCPSSISRIGPDIPKERQSG